MSQNLDKSEIHGCIVCGRLFTVLAIYSPGGALVDFTVTSPAGRRVEHERQPLVACTTHSVAEIDRALERWSTTVGAEAHKGD